MQILEDRIPFRTGQLVDIGDRRLGVAGAVTGPARQQRCDQVRDWSAYRLIDVRLRGRVFLQLQIVNADHQPGNAIGFVDGQNPLGEPDGLVDVAVRQRGDEGAVQQLVVLRIDAKRRAVERRSSSGIPFHAGMPCRQIAAGHRQRFQIMDGRELRRVVGRVIGRLRRKRARHGKRGEGEGGNRPAIETGGKHHGSPLAPELQEITARSCDHSRMRTPPAASSPLTMPRLAFNRKDTGGELIGRNARAAAGCLKTLPVWPYRGRVPCPQLTAHAIVVTSPRNSVRRRPPVEPR